MRLILRHPEEVEGQVSDSLIETALNRSMSNAKCKMIHHSSTFSLYARMRKNVTSNNAIATEKRAIINPGE